MWEHTESWLDSWLDRWTAEQLRKEKKRKEKTSWANSTPLQTTPLHWLIWLICPCTAESCLRLCLRLGGNSPAAVRCCHPARLTSSPLILSTLPALSPASPQAMSPAILVPALLQQSRAAPLDLPRSRHSSRHTVPNSRCKVHHWSCSCGDSNSKRAPAAPRWSSSKTPYMQQRFSTVVCTSIATGEGLYCFC